jgi:hypothetical protein
MVAAAHGLSRGLSETMIQADVRLFAARRADGLLRQIV